MPRGRRTPSILSGLVLFLIFECPVPLRVDHIMWTCFYSFIWSFSLQCPSSSSSSSSSSCRNTFCCCIIWLWRPQGPAYVRTVCKMCHRVRALRQNNSWPVMKLVDLRSHVKAAEHVGGFHRLRNCFFFCRWRTLEKKKTPNKLETDVLFSTMWCWRTFHVSCRNDLYGSDGVF